MSLLSFLLSNVSSSIILVTLEVALYHSVNPFVKQPCLQMFVLLWVVGHIQALWLLAH